MKFDTIFTIIIFGLFMLAGVAFVIAVDLAEVTRPVKWGLIGAVWVYWGFLCTAMFGVFSNSE